MTSLQAASRKHNWVKFVLSGMERMLLKILREDKLLHKELKSDVAVMLAMVQSILSKWEEYR
jgi:hypothetical protein